MDSNDEPFAVTQSSIPAAEGNFEQFAPGRILATKYKVISILGKGGMGTVYRVEQIFFQKELALKVLDSRGAFNDIQVRRFQTEAKAAFSLNHPNLVKVHDCGVFEDGQPYLVMDYVPGTTLADLLKQQGPLTIDQVSQIFPQACFGIAFAHQQSIIHRDIKPSNIMLVDGIALGAEGSVKIVDFGIAKVASEEGGEIQGLTKTGEIFGSPLYMSPEQCSGEQIDARTDIYSLGCVLFEALTGTPPLVGNNALRTMMLHQTEPIPTLKEASMGKDFPNGFEHIVQKMLQKSAADRYDNLGVVAHEIAEASKGSYEIADSISKTAGHQGSQKALQKSSAADSKMLNSSFVAGLVAAGIVAAAVCAAMLIINNSDKTETTTPTKTTSASPPNLKELTSPENGFNSNGWIQSIKAFGNGEISPDELTNQIEILKTAKPIKSQLVQRNGKKKKLFVFPACGIGRITNRITAEETFEKVHFGKIEAREEQLVPADSPLTLEINCHGARHVFSYPSVLEKIDPKEFVGLVLSTRVPITMPSQLSEELISLSSLKMLNIASTWANVQSINIQDLPKSVEILEIINKFPALQSFQISSPDDSEGKYTSDRRKELGSAEWASIIRKQPFMKKLKRLGLEEIQINGILPTFSSLPKLEALDLTDTSVSPQAILSLRNCPHLEVLRFCEHDGPTDEQLKALAQLKQISILYIKETNLTPAQLKLLTAAGRNTKLLISSKSKAAVEAFRPAEQRIEVVVEQ